jgi:ankyrin repeat protein
MRNMDQLVNLVANEEPRAPEKPTNKNMQAKFFSADQTNKETNTTDNIRSPLDTFAQFFGGAYGQGQPTTQDHASAHSANKATVPSLTEVYSSLFNMPNKIKQYKETLEQHNKKVIDTNKHSNCDVFYHIAHNSNDDVIFSAIDTTHANLSTRDQFGNTVLHLATLCGRTHLVEMLLTHRAELDNQNNSGNTPLHLAISTHQKQIVKLLIEHGARVHINNKHGFDQITLATADKDSDYATLLIKSPSFKLT